MRVPSQNSFSCTLLVLILLVFMTIPMVQVNGLTNFTKRRAITINNLGPALTDYQILLKVNYDSDMQADFDDLRFTDSDGITVLSYWIMEKTDSAVAYVWVKVPSIPGSGSKTIYMYYGNPSVSSTSDGEETFDFFDDFGADNALNTDKWDEAKTGATIDWSSSEYVEVSGSGGQDWIIKTKQSNPVDFIAEFKLNIISFSGASRKFVFQTYDETDNIIDYPINWGTYDWGAGPDGDLLTGVRWFKVILRSDGWSVYSRTSLDSPWEPWRSGGWTEDLLKPALRHYTGSPTIPGTLTERWYYYFHRKYAPTEPTVSIGPEETYTGIGQTEIDEKDEADTKVTITASQEGFTTITKLSSNPNGPPPAGFIPLKYIRIETTATISKAIIKIYYTDQELMNAGILPETLRIYRAVGNYWEPLPTTFGSDVDGKYCQTVVASLSDFSLMGSTTSPVGGEMQLPNPLAVIKIILLKNLGALLIGILSIVAAIMFLKRYRE